jgi:radical SAM enzyme (TIGR01210 family)
MKTIVTVDEEMKWLSDIEKLRPPRNTVDPEIPYHFLQEEEPGEDGKLQKVNTIFLTGKECAFKCLMCDLWKNTLTFPTPPGAILKQIDYALSRLPDADVIKLYNSSNFFDTKAIPLSDYAGIIDRVRHFKKVVVENHPKHCTQSCVDFNKQLNGKLEMALGLESIHPNVLPKLNKSLTIENFQKATTFLKRNKIRMRAFVLLNPPFLVDEKENIEWAVRTVAFAFECGVGICSVIPTRVGNGIMEVLQKRGDYVTPTLNALEEVLERSLALHEGKVFADTWDIGFLSGCDQCFDARKNRLEQMNLTQKFVEKIKCNCAQS